MKTLLAFLLSAVFSPTAVRAEGITLMVEGLRNDHGKVLVAVFDQARAFEQLLFNKAVRIVQIPARAGRVEYQLPTLNTGPYAIFLLHDENADQELNHDDNTLLEGVGASGAPNPDDVPSFAEAAFPPGPVHIKVHYDR